MPSLPAPPHLCGLPDCTLKGKVGAAQGPWPVAGDLGTFLSPVVPSLAFPDQVGRAPQSWTPVLQGVSALVQVDSCTETGIPTGGSRKALS